MACEDFLPLVEKLSDGEATPAEKRKADAHLKECADCREHLHFLEALPRAARKMSATDPPPSYWESLPGKVMRRISEREAPDRQRMTGAGFFSPSVLRWAGVLAAAVVAAVVGLRVLDAPFSTDQAPEVSLSRQAQRVGGDDDAGDEEISVAEEDQVVGEGLGTSTELPSAPTPAPPRERQDAREPARDQSASSVASTAEESFLRDEPAAADREQPLQKAEAETESSEVASPPALEEEMAEGARGLQVVDRPAEPSQSRPAATGRGERRLQADAANLRQRSASEDYRALEERYPLEPGTPVESTSQNLMSTQAGATAPRDKAAECTDWRRFLEQHDAVEEGTGARYRLALCSIALYDLQPSEANRRQALQDVESYLAVDPRSDRADALRRALGRIEP